MTKFSLAFVLLLAFASVLALTKEEAKHKLKEITKKCNSDPATTVDYEAVKKWHKDGGDRPEKLGAHALCMSKEMGHQDHDGKIVKETLKEHLTRTFPEDKVDEILNECAIEKPTPEKTAGHMFVCLMKHRHEHK